MAAANNVDRQNIDNESRLLAYDYVDYRLRQSGFGRPNRPADLVPDPPTSLMLTMRSICDHFNERYAQDLGEGSGVTVMSSLPLSSNEALSWTFSNVCNSLFRPNGEEVIEITGGRIFALYAFGGSLAVECMNQRKPELVDQVATLLDTYARMNLSDWIASKGGWDRFVHGYHDVGTPSSITKKVWGGFGAVCGALGVVALAAVLVSRH